MCKAVCLNIFLHLERLVYSDLGTTKLKKTKKPVETKTRAEERQTMSVWLFLEALT